MNRTKKMVTASMLCALVCVATMVIKIQLTPNGYINLGDAVVVVCSLVLGGPYGFLAAGIGSLVADLLSGFAVYAPASFFIKGAMAVTVGFLIKRLAVLNAVARVIVAVFCAELIMVLGYYLFEGALYGFAVALSSMPGNLIQSLAGLVLGSVMIKLFENNRFTK